MQPSTASPIFIVGAPRSGTSLLRVMLNRHPAIGICDETYYFYYVYTRRHAFGDLNDPEARRHLIDRYLATQRVQRLGLDPRALAETLMREGDAYDTFFASLLRFYASSHDKPRCGEKTPQHALVAETLCTWFPDCALIHIVRDPRDVVASLLRMPWARDHVMPNARLWTACTSAAERCHHRANYLRVHYEQLIDNPENTLRTICRFVGEPFDPAMLDAETQARSDLWWFQRAQEPLHKSRVGTWQDQLSAREVALVEHVAGEVMEAVGYERASKGPRPLALAWALIEERVGTAWQKATNLPRLWYHWTRPTQLAADEAWTDRHSAKPTESG